MTINIQNIIQLITVGGGVFIFFRGLHEYKKNNRIKRAGFLDQLIKEFLEKDMELARNMLDDYVYVLKKHRDMSPVEQKQLAVPLAIYLRDHSIKPISAPEEIIVRRSFDKLLDFFTRLSYYLGQKLISPSELCYFRYYLEKMESKPEVLVYIRRYFYMEDFVLLFDAVKILQAK